MAKLSEFKTDIKKVEQGEWISPGDEYADLEFLARGFTDKYNDARAGRLRRAAQSLGGDVEKIPTALVRSITVDCLISHLLIDVRGLVDEHGTAITIGQFAELIRSGDYPDLYVAALRAVAQVGKNRSAVIEEAVGNSAAASE
jgi:hypothetical protein